MASSHDMTACPLTSSGDDVVSSSSDLDVNTLAASTTSEAVTQGMSLFLLY